MQKLKLKINVNVIHDRRERMEFEGVPDYPEQVISSIRANPPKEVNMNETSYLSGADIMERNFSGTKTQHYVEQAESNGNLDAIQQYIDPIGFEVHVSKSKSWLLNITDDAVAYGVDLSRLKLLAQGSQMGKITGGHQYEVFMTGDEGLASDYEDKMKEQLDAIREDMNE